MGFSSTLRLYSELSKPRIVFLLVFTAFGSMIVGSGLNVSLVTLGLVILAVTLGSAGSSALTGYIDRDIDEIMHRTRNRPIPSGKLSPKKALNYGLFLATLSIILSYVASPLSALFMFIGIFDNVIIYSKILKRRHISNIVLGGISGGMPVLVGYAALQDPSKPWFTAVLMSALVIIWIPEHIWSLALYFKEDYSRVNVPMLPVVVSEKTAVRTIGLTSILTVAFSILLYFVGIFGIIYLATAIVLGGFMLAFSIWLLFDPTKDRSWQLFKYSSPYLMLIFIGMMIDSVL